MSLWAWVGLYLVFAVVVGSAVGRLLGRLSRETGDLVVCTTHQRFIPCRKDGPHHYSAKASDVQAVGRSNQ